MPFYPSEDVVQHIHNKLLLPRHREIEKQICCQPSRQLHVLLTSSPLIASATCCVSLHPVNLDTSYSSVDNIIYKIYKIYKI